MNWAPILLLAALLAGLGPVIDRLLLARHKGKLHTLLLRAWNRLDETAVPLVPKMMAEFLLKAANMALSLNRFKLLLCLAVASSILTYLGTFVPLFTIVFEQTLTFETVKKLFLLAVNDPESIAVLCGINLAFDIATLFVFVWMLRAVSSKKALAGGAACLAGLLCTALFAVMRSLSALCFPGLGGMIRSWRDLTLFAVSSIFIALQHLLALEKFPGIYPHGPGVDVRLHMAGYFGCATLIPVGVYVGLTLIAYLGKGIGDLVRRATMHLCEVATEEEAKKLSLFTLLGGLAGALVLVVNTGRALHSYALTTQPKAAEADKLSPAAPQVVKVESPTIARIKKIVVNQLDVLESQVDQDSDFTKDLGATSLSRVEIIMAIEEAFDVDISDSESAMASSVRAAAALVTLKEEAKRRAIGVGR